MRFLFRRLLLAIPLLWGVLTLLFLLLHAMPGDAADYYFHPDLPSDLAERMRVSLGLADSLPVQYLRWLGNALTFDFQFSLITHRPAMETVALALPRTLLLCGSALVLAYLLGIPLGVFSALRQERSSGRWANLLALLGLSAPSFFVGIVLIFVFSYVLGWFPASGANSVNADLLSPAARLLDGLWHLCLPAFSLALVNAAIIARYARQGMIDTLGQDFVRTARAKGLAEIRVAREHALRGALLPLITLLGLQLPFLVSGAVIVESVFGWNGMGSLLVGSILHRDFPVVLAAVFFLSVLVILGSALADFLYRIADPRVQQT